MQMDTQQLIQEITDAFNKHDVEAFTNAYAIDAIGYDPQYEQPLRGQDAFRKDFSDFIRAFPDVKTQITGPVLTNGSTSAFEIEVIGTHKGVMASPGGEIPPTNKKMAFKVGRFIHFNSEGKITTCNRHYDMMNIMAQLGFLPQDT